MNVSQDGAAAWALGGVAEGQARKVEVGRDDNVPGSALDSFMQLLGRGHEADVCRERIHCLCSRVKPG